MGFDRISLYFANSNGRNRPKFGDSTESAAESKPAEGDSKMKATTKITFYDDQGRKFFGEGPARLLRGIEEKGSLRAAALSMEMAYTKALSIIKNAEQTLGFLLLIRSTGGKSGGGSKLTEEGKEWLERYETYRDACIQSNGRLYLEFFPEQR